MLLCQLVHDCPLKIKVEELNVHSAALHLKDIAEGEVGALLSVHLQSFGGNVWPVLLPDSLPEHPVLPAVYGPNAQGILPPSGPCTYRI